MKVLIENIIIMDLAPSEPQKMKNEKEILKIIKFGLK